ncbi:50S ribosomal protein L13 [Candidatus Falkowbacteria bacterium CG10_big_fil_rev_8_21_14_0_10_39_11]|uniref:Large ribosomal subunit protein uL13 n=1 Tax=Candidatus Falkowbacteria bacterium CG10_big_fil_rev_8_21_14_0_10_39_11 TaxID=1974565 RepID=A0A2H0V5N5_9BACT|nr:MAG: 50S ribosomal protein L13 [Candidatus Falkowbacteria bacterium CG10_big_fil_rev_8_21_14_0_10_39_11]
MARQTHTIDATDKVLGRLASKIATILRGKNKVSFQPHIDDGDFVNIKNVAKIKLTGKKLEQKVYYRHTGYPGGLREKKASDLMVSKPEEVLRTAVVKMLPKTRLRSGMIKRLKFLK